jgi:nucleoside-diphosphate-sugar epimerase
VKRIAVTGASGFIGRHVVGAVAARGDHAIPIARPYLREHLTRTFEGVDAVVHLAGVVSAVHERDFYAANVDAARVVADAAAIAGARLVHISSLAAAGPAPPNAPRREDDRSEPITTYGLSKLAGEHAIAAVAGLRWTILRPGVVYGPGDRAIRPLFRYAKRGVLPLVGNDRAAYTFVFVADAVRAILAAVDRGADRDVIFVGHPNPVSPRRLMETVRMITASHAPIITIPRAVIRVAAEVGEWSAAISGKPAVINRRRFAELYAPGFVCTVDRMKERLGVVAETDLREGLQKSAGWYVATMADG